MSRPVKPKEILLFRRLLLDWIIHNRRDFPWRNPSISNYKKIISEILLQRTKAETVARFFPVFFNEYSSWKKLASTSLEDLERVLQPIGLFKQRSTHLKNLAEAIVIRGSSIPMQREEIENLPGVGQYVANAIELLCYGRPQPLLDVNMARVLERYFGPRKLADIRYDPYLQKLAHNVVDCEDPVTINFSILDFAALVCKLKNPVCDKCVLSRGCVFLND